MIAKRLLVGLVTFGSVALGIVTVELAPSVSAQQPPPFLMPHGGYGEDTELCAVCHDWHASPDPDRFPDQLLTFPFEQLLAAPTEVDLCYSCHDGSGADANVEQDFGAGSRRSFHPVLAPAGEILLTCSSCHAPHQSPDVDAELLYREMSPGIYLFSPPEAPIGDTFCYGCHGSASTLPAPLGDHAAFETSIHNTSDRVEPPTSGTDLKCSACHEPHASDYRYLTRANEEELCYTCHSSADPNTAGGSNPQAAFTAAANDYATDDGDGLIRIYHHPVATDEQADGARSVECASCHNSHLLTRTETASDPARARALDSGWRFDWDTASGAYYRSPNAAEYCGTCHVTPTTTGPLTASVDVPYDINLVNDTDAGGRPHDLFDLAWFLSGAGSAHGSPAYTPSEYPACPPGGQPCELACTACHDFHGSSNAYMLREDIASPDYRPLAVSAATWTPGEAGGPGTAELTVGPHRIEQGWSVTVSGMDPVGFDGVWTVTAVTATTISFELDPDPGPYVGGGTLVIGGPDNRPSSATVVNFGGLDTSPDRNKLQTFCLTCHLEQSSSHQNGTLCTQCHNHDPNSPGGF